MKLNHFMIPYYGNKRTECKIIYDNLNFEGVETIVEPFCGTSAISYYISTLHPLKYTYHLNDNNPLLIELYNIAKDEDKYKLFIDELTDLRTQLTDKIKYDALDFKTLKGWIYKHKIYSIKPGIFPLNTTQSPDIFNKMLKAPMIHFLRTENIIITNDCGIKILNDYKDNDKALVFLDPPYLQASNYFYTNSDVNIYEYLYKNPIINFKCKLYLCLELVWIIKMLFDKYEIIEYDKTYSVISYLSKKKKKVIHGLILNVLK